MRSTVEGPPYGTKRDRSNAFPQVHKAHVTPINTLAPLTGCRVGPQPGRKTTQLLLKLRLNSQLDSPLQHPGIGLPGEAKNCDPLYLEHTIQSPFLCMRTTSPVYQSRDNVPNLHMMFKRRASPTISRALSYSGQILFVPKPWHRGFLWPPRWLQTGCRENVLYIILLLLKGL